MSVYAHTFKYEDGRPAPESEWEPLFTPFGDGVDQCQQQNCEKCRRLDRDHGHLCKVAYWSAKFACEMFPPGSAEAAAACDWGYLAGLWHDLGKFAPEWQKYLAAKMDIHASDSTGRIDHSTAGAKFANKLKPLGELLAYVIAGHHAGLACGTTLFNERLVNRKIADWQGEAESAGVPLSLPIPLPPLQRPDANSTDLAFMVRYFYSCLVDADFLATEAFMNPTQSKNRSIWPADLLDRMIETLEKYLETRFGQSEPTSVNQKREEVRQACAAASGNPPGFFSLTVPTGGGKTLSSLLFALKHARKNGLRRVIFVIPFTSIIQQNADVFRSVFADLSKEIGQEIVLEHHSKFEPVEGKETVSNRLAAENWNAPLIVTTNVRFFESLFANRSSECRKLHRTARSVVVFDEVQALPVHLLAPILSALQSLVKDFGTTAVLCTATQPALEHRDDFTVGIPKEEIVPMIADEKSLFDTLRRVESRNLGKVEDQELIDHILRHSHDGCLLVFNTTRAAQHFYEKLNEHVKTLHLSARMCSAHVISVLEHVKKLRAAGEPVILVSTQLIEAGVDISFPVVYRAESGLDSIAQAAGRCNRNGELVGADGRSVYRS